MRRELLTWDDIDMLIDHMIPQFNVEFEGMVMITRGGIVPGGLLAAALHLENILTAAVDFPAEAEMDSARQSSRFLAWPKFIQFPENKVLAARRILIVENISGVGQDDRCGKESGSRWWGAFPTPVFCTSILTATCLKILVPITIGAVTDAYIVYPWENPRGPKGAFLTGLEK